MAILLSGPGAYRFEQVVINRLIRPGVPGIFALGVKDEKESFIPKLIGRSDVDLWGDLMAKAETPSYPFFKFAVTSPRNAYEMECATFHSYPGKLDNKAHPVSPAGLDLKCFLCGN